MKKERGSVPTPGMSTGLGWGTRGGEKSGDVEPGGVPREAGRGGEARTCCRARPRQGAHASLLATADPAAHLTSPGDCRWRRGDTERGRARGLWTRLGWSHAHHGRFSTPGSSLSHFPAPPCSLALLKPATTSPTPSDPRRSAVGVLCRGAMKAARWGGRRPGREAGLQRHHSSSSSYRGAEVAGGRPPPRTPLLRFPSSSSQTSSPPPPLGRSGLGSERVEVGRAERDERGMAVAGTQAGRGGGLGRLARGPPPPHSGPGAPSQSLPPATHAPPLLACCSLGEDAGAG